MSIKANLDNLATRPVDPGVIEIMLPYFGELFGNPVYYHQWGDQTSEAIENALAQIAGLINGRPDEIILT